MVVVSSSSDNNKNCRRTHGVIIIQYMVMSMMAVGGCEV